AVHQPPHRQVSPAEGLHEARHQLARPARPSPRANTKRRVDLLTTERRPSVRVGPPTTGHDCPRGLSTCRMRVRPVLMTLLGTSCASNHHSGGSHEYYYNDCQARGTWRGGR